MTELTKSTNLSREHYREVVYGRVQELIGSSPEEVRAIWVLDKGWTDSPKARAEMEARTAFSCVLALSIEEMTGNAVPIIAVGGELKGQEKSGAQTVRDIAVDMFHISEQRVIDDPISNQTSVEAGAAKVKARHSRLVETAVSPDQDLLVGVTYRFHQQRAQDIADKNKTNQKVRIISWTPELYDMLKEYLQSNNGKYQFDWEAIDTMITSAILSPEEEASEQRYERTSSLIIDKIPRLIANALVTRKRGTPTRLSAIRKVVKS